MKLLFPVLLAAYTFVAVFTGVHYHVGWKEIAATGPLGVVAFCVGYCVDLLIFGALVRGTARQAHRARLARESQ